MNRREPAPEHMTLKLPQLKVTMVDGARIGAGIRRPFELVIPRWWDARRWLVWAFKSPLRVQVEYANATRVHRARAV